MVNLSWFDIVDRRLRARWLPPAYRRRVVQELKDHAEEILERCTESVRSTSEAESLFPWATLIRSDILRCQNGAR